MINVWFVQATVAGSPVGSTATITGPEQTTSTIAPTYATHVPADQPETRSPRHRPPEQDGIRWVHCVTFAGNTPADVLYRGHTWMAAHQHEVEISDVGWTATAERASEHRLTVYYRTIP